MRSKHRFPKEMSWLKIINLLAPMKKRTSNKIPKGFFNDLDIEERLSVLVGLIVCEKEKERRKR